jgi:hypothetical protein
MRPHYSKISIASVLALSSVVMPAAAHARDNGYPAPLLGSMVTDIARTNALNSSIRNSVKKEPETAQSKAQKARVYKLVTQYSDCRAGARAYASNPAKRDAVRAACTQQYQPQFGKACVGGANKVAICSRLRNTGSIEW